MAAILKILAPAMVGISIVGMIGSSSLFAQNINVSSPFQSVSGGFYENHGVNSGFAFPGGRENGSRVVGFGPQGQLLPNVMFQNIGGVTPPFGGFDPNGGASFGFNAGGFSLGMNLSKGSTRTSSTTTPTLTTQNGFGGSIFNGSVRPFVTGVVPVVGNGSIRPGFTPIYQPDNGVTRAIQSGQLNLNQRSESEPSAAPEQTFTFSNEESSAVRGDLSVKQIKAQRQRNLAAKSRKIEAALIEASELASKQEYAEARIKYREALKQTDDDAVKARIKSQINATRK